MKATHLILAIASSFLLASCFSTMRVRVDALNMPAFRASFLYNAELINTRDKNIRYVLSPAFQQKVHDLNLQLATFVDTSGEVPDEDQARFKTYLKDRTTSVLKEITDAGGAALQASASLLNTPNAGTTETYEKNYASLTVAFNGLIEFNRYAKEIKEDFGLSLPPATAILLDDVSATIERVASVFGTSILTDPLASVIAALPEQYWSKYKKDVNLSMNAGGITQQSLGDVDKYVRKQSNRFNNTYARTYWGNSDIAIRMASPGEFIVKGVRVDADEAVRNSFKVVSQGIKYIAYASGIPVVEPGNAPPKSINPLLDSLTRQDTDLRSAEEQNQKATDAFLAVLVSASADLNATRNRGGQTVAQLKDSALNRIKTAYGVYKAALVK